MQHACCGNAKLSVHGTGPVNAMAKQGTQQKQRSGWCPVGLKLTGNFNFGVFSLIQNYCMSKGTYI